MVNSVIKNSQTYYLSPKIILTNLYKIIMTYKKIIISALAILFFINSAQAQLSELVTPREKLLKALKNIEEKKYGAAQSLLLDFNVNDSFYELSGYYLAICYDNQRDYENAFKIAKKFANDLTANDREAFYEMAGSSSFYGKNHQEGVDLLKEGIVLFPQDIFLYDKLARNYIMLGQDSLAYNSIMVAMKINPLYPGILESLGELNARNGNYTQASMAWYLALFSKYHRREFSSRAFNLILKFEGVLGGNFDANNFPFNWDGGKDNIEDYKKLPLAELVSKTFKIPNYYPNTDEVLVGQLANNARYKSKTKLNIIFAKRSQIMAESMPSESKPKRVGDDYFMYHNVLENLLVKVNNDVKLLRPFQYAVLGLTNNSKAAKYLAKKKTKEVHPANIQIVKIVSESMLDVPLFFDGKMQKTYRRFSAYNLNLYAAGNLIDESKADEKANRKDWWQFYFDNGFIKNQGNYKNGEKDGTWVEFDKKGKKAYQYEYNNNELVRFQIYEENGYVKIDKRLKKGELIDSSFYYYPDGALKSWIYLPNGPKSKGKISDFTTFGYNNLVCDLINFDLDGVYYYKNGDGVLVYQSFYKKGKKDGFTSDYYSTGALFAKGEYKEGEKYGKWEYFNIDGQKTSVYNFNSKGKKEGEQTSYNKDGSIAAITQYKNGEKDGVQKYYNENGKIINEETYSSNKLSGIKNYDLDGKEIYASKKLDGSSSSISTKHPNGVTANTGDLKNGLETGTWSYYNELGVLFKTIEFKKGERNGKVVNYYKSGLKSYEYFTKDDEKDGLYISYYANGKKYETGYYKEGEKYGEWLSYFKDGALEEKYYYLSDEMIGFQNDYDVKGNINNSTYYKDNWSYYKVSFDSMSNAIDTLYYVDPVANMYYELSVSGDTTFVSNLLHNKLHGTAISYQNGIITGTSKSKQGDLEGEIIKKNILGQKLYKSTYENGKKVFGEDFYEETGLHSYIGYYKRGYLDSITTYFYPNGKVSVTSTYVLGDMEGKHVRYTPEGNIAYILYYKDDQLYSYGASENDQKIIDSKLIRVRLNYENGDPKASFNIKNGVIDSVWNIYYKNGNMAEVRHYNFGSRSNTDTLFYSNGTVNEIETYNLGDYHGVRKRFDSKGYPVIEINYLNDVKHGWELHYANGKLVKQAYYYNGDIIYIKP